MKSSILTLAAISALAMGSGQAALIYSADFSTGGIGFVHTTAAPPAAAPASATGGALGSQFTLSYSATPATDTSSNTFVTSGGQLISSDFGGAASFLTQVIDVSALSGNVDLSATAETAFGTAVFNSQPTEGFQWFYVLDAVRTNIGSKFTADGSLNMSQSVDISSASSLQVGFDFNINGDADGFTISAVTVNAVPEPSAALLGALGALALLRRRR